MFLHCYGRHVLSFKTEMTQCMEVNDLGVGKGHCPLLGSMVRVIELGDATLKAALPFYITDGNHALILGAQFQMSCTCYKAHDHLRYTCFHSHAVPKYCEHGLPIY